MQKIKRKEEKRMKKLVKSSSNRYICGVCGGIADYLNVDPTIVRLAWVLFCLLGGLGRHHVAHQVGVNRICCLGIGATIIARAGLNATISAFSVLVMPTEARVYNIPVINVMIVCGGVHGGIYQVILGLAFGSIVRLARYGCIEIVVYI